MNDVPFEAAFLRAGLLLGLCHERDVPGWAERLIIHAPPEWTSGLADVIGTKVELSALRTALQPLSESVVPSRVAAALLSLLGAEPPVVARRVEDQLRILGQMRWEFRLPSSLDARIRDFEHRAMLERAGMKGQFAATHEEMTTFLADVRAPGFFRFSVDDAEELAAFAAALSRKVARNRTWADRPGHLPSRAWVLREPEGLRSAVVLNESAWHIVVREFGPIPLSSRVPYPEPGMLAVPVLDEVRTPPLELEDARALTAAPKAG